MGTAWALAGAGFRRYSTYRQATVAEVAAAHVGALDAQIRTLRLRRAVLAAVALRKPGPEEMTLMNKLARLSAQERRQIIDGEDTAGDLVIEHAGCARIVGAALRIPRKD